MISFDMVAKLTIGKETEKFKPYETTEYKSGWTNRTLRFNAISGDNRFMLTAKGGCYSDGSGDLYLFSKDSVDESGNKVKGKMFTISFKDRFNEDKITFYVKVTGNSKMLKDKKLIYKKNIFLYQGLLKTTGKKLKN